MTTFSFQGTLTELLIVAPSVFDSGLLTVEQEHKFLWKFDSVLNANNIIRVISQYIRSCCLGVMLIAENSS
ncbi:MAG: hypothetical protein V7K54_04735 [Nostoc sp.]